MMGSGYRDFAAGAVLTADQVDGYLMRQSVMTFATEAARDSALSGVLDEGMVTYQEDSNRTTFYDGAAWVVLNEPPQAWATVATSQSGAVTNTVAYSWTRRSNGMFIAQAALNITGTGTAGNAIEVATPFTLPNSEAIGGSYTYLDQGATVYSGSIYPSTTTAFTLQSDGSGDRLGSTPSFAMANTDILRFSITGRYA